MVVINCYKCQKEVPDEVNYCPHCGCQVINGSIDTMAKEFEKRVWDVIKTVKSKYHYNPTLFIQGIQQHGAVNEIKRLINAPQPSSGYTRLWELGALKFSAEALALEVEWEKLFTAEELLKAKKRLKDYGYFD